MTSWKPCWLSKQRNDRQIGEVIGLVSKNTKEILSAAILKKVSSVELSNITEVSTIKPNLETIQNWLNSVEETTEKSS